MTLRPTPSPPASSALLDDPAATAVCRQTWTYDSEGNVLTHTDRRGITSVNAYDRENRLVSEARAGLVLRNLERDADGNVHRQIDALGRVTTLIYDKAGRKLSEDRSGLAVERWTYTPLGDAAMYTDADGRTTTNTYTPRRFLESESLAGETTRYAYDGAGHRTSRERPNGPDSTWTYAYDAAGNLASVTDPLAQTTTFGHDANNNRTRITDANGHVTTFAYDERNRLEGKTYSGGDSWRWGYDGDNNRIRSEAPNGRVTETAYDALNRPTRTNYRDAPAGEVQSTAFTYDGNSNVRTITETGSAGTRTETRDYDDFDRLTQVVDGDGRSLHYAYDAVGNRTRLTDADGHDTVWTYNDLNQNTRVTVPGMGSTSLGYAPSGRVTEISRPDGSLTEQAFFDDGRLQSIRHSKTGQTLARYDYVYDPNGNRTEQRELNGATTGDTPQRTRYVYDEADRLVEVQEPNRTTSYTLDAVGNRIAERAVDGNGTVISDSALVFNDRDQLTSRSDPVAHVQVEQTWDRNGNLATQAVNGQPPRVYGYDARDRLVGLTLPSSANGPTTLAFAYNADGLRREKTDGLTTTRYQYDGQSLLAETNAIGNTLRRFHYSATQLIAQTQAGTTPVHRHILLDALRSPIALLDPTGLVTARTSYDAFGEIRTQLGTNGTLTTPNRDGASTELASADNQPVGFTGYIKDSESGLYYAKARYYDPATARFTTEDPEAGKDLEPPSLHRYLYAYVNPTVYVDTTGRIQELVAGADMIASWNSWLKHRSNEVEPGVAGTSVALGVGIGRGLLSLTEGGVRLVNVAANLGVLGIDTVDQATNDNYRGNILADESAHELMGTAHAIRQFDEYLQNDGVFRTYDAAVEDTSYAFNGRHDSLSNVTSTLTTLAAPTKLSTLDIGAVANGAYNAARNAAAKAWEQGKAFVVREGASSPTESRTPGSILKNDGPPTGETYDSKKLERVLAAAKRQGVSVEQGVEAERFLKAIGAGAAYFPASGAPGTVILPTNPTRSMVLEELMHYGQYKRAGFPTSDPNQGGHIQGLMFEIQAQQRLRSIAEKKRWTPAEIEHFESAEKIWRGMLDDATDASK